MTLTVDDLRECHFKPVLYADGAGGMAMQVRSCVEHPTFEVVWSRENGRDPGRTRFTVGGIECPDLRAVADLLNAEASASVERAIQESGQAP